MTKLPLLQQIDNARGDTAEVDRLISKLGARTLPHVRRMCQAFPPQATPKKGSGLISLLRRIL